MFAFAAFLGTSKVQPSYAPGHRCKSTLGPSAVYNTHHARGNEAKTKVRLMAGCDGLVSVNAWWNSFSDLFAPRSPLCHPRPGRSFRATGPSAQNCRPSVHFGFHVLLTIQDAVKSVVSHPTVCSSIPSRSAKRIANQDASICPMLHCASSRHSGTAADAQSSHVRSRYSGSSRGRLARRHHTTPSVLRGFELQAATRGSDDPEETLCCLGAMTPHTVPKEFYETPTCGLLLSPIPNVEDTAYQLLTTRVKGNSARSTTPTLFERTPNSHFSLTPARLCSCAYHHSN